jgi:hypothetical protein
LACSSRPIITGSRAELWVGSGEVADERVRG